MPSLKQRSRSRSVITPTSSSPSITTVAPVSASTIRLAASPMALSGRDGHDLGRHDVGELHRSNCTGTPVLRRAASTALAGWCLIDCSSRAPSAPEQARWSQASVTVMIERTTICAVDHHRPLDRGADREDRRLGRIDDRRERRHVHHAQVRDGERAALDLVLLEPAGAGTRPEVARGDRDLAQAAGVGRPQHRHDQAVVERDRDADVGVRVVGVLAVDVGAVGLGMLASAPSRTRARSDR